MPWLNRGKLPPEYENLTPEEITARLKTAEENATKVTSLEAKVKETDTTIATLNQKAAQVDVLSSQIEELRKKAEQRHEPDPPAPLDPGLADWLADPKKAFQDSFNAASAPLATATLVSGALAARVSFDDFMRKLGGLEWKLWQKYEREVTALVEKLPPEQRIWPQSWSNQFTFVKGMHAQEIHKAASAADTAFFSEGVTQNGTGFTGTTEEPEKLSEMELKVAKAMKVKPEDYAKRKKDLQGQGRGFWTT